MKKILSLVVLLASGFIARHVNAQTSFLCYNFEPSGATPPSFILDPTSQGNGWLINNSYAGGFFGIIPNTPNQPAAITGSPQSNYLHVCSDFAVSQGVTNANYESSSGGAKASFTVSTTGKTGVYFEMWTLNKGNGVVEYSVNNGTTWSNLGTVSNQGTWVKRTFAPGGGVLDNQANLMIRFNFSTASSDPGWAIDEICFYEAAPTNTLTTGAVPGASFCAGAGFTLPFTSTGTFAAGNVYTAQLSDATGSFASPTNIGTLTSTANSGNIACTIPAGASAGTNYRVRVISSNPALTATDNGINFTINTSSNPTVSIASDIGTTICTGQAATFTATPTGLGTATSSYQWFVNGTAVVGATNATFSPASINNGDQISVDLMFTGPCVTGTATSNTLTMTVSTAAVVLVTISASPSDHICPGQTVTFTATPTNGGSNPTYQWQLNGNPVGTNSATYTSSTLANGDKVVVYITSNSPCVVSPTNLSDPIFITSGLQVSCSTTSAVMGTPASVNLTVNGGTAPYTYQVLNFGDNASDTQNNVNATNATFNHTYVTDGTYNVQIQVTDATGCSGTSSCTMLITNNVVTVPTAGFTATPITGCDPLVVNFTNTTTHGTTYLWDFGDGSTSTDENPTHTYTGLVGGVTVRLIATNANGSDTLTQINVLQVYPQPIANASLNSPVCLGSPAVFNNQSVNTISWAWNFGDGTTGTDANPVHTYSTTGTYHITLDVTGLGGCFASTAFTVDVVDTAISSFTAPALTSQCKTAEYTFTNSSTGATSYTWDFGDGGTSTDPNPSHSYAQNGTFNIVLYAFSTNGCVSKSTQSLTVNMTPPPVAAFTVDSTILKLPNASITPVNHSTGADSYIWISGEGDTIIVSATSPTPTITYKKTGTYKLKLFAYRSDGCVDSTFIEIRVDIDENLYVPNVFTPNGDGINDEFFVIQAGFSTYSIQIYDRWGVLVKKLTESEKWDGTYNGKPAPEGVYVVVFKGTRDPNRLNAYKTSGEFDFVSSLTLVR